MKFNRRQTLHTQTPHTIRIVEPKAPHFRFLCEHQKYHSFAISKINSREIHKYFIWKVSPGEN